MREFTLASLQDIGFLNLKDSQFVEDVLVDISHFQEAGNSYRVLVFPPFASYNRLLIHKVVEAEFPDLITFSVGEQIQRRTVVAFVEACHRGEKGIQLLSQPKEARTKPSSNSSSKWRNLSSQERVANWVRLREIKSRKREVWNSPKLFNVSDLEQDGIDTNVDSLNEEDKIDRSKPKEQGTALYVPPYLRARKRMEISQDSNENNSQSSYTGSSTPSLPEQNHITVSPSPEAQDESKRPRGRGRGRRKPEIQVYVPKARRESKQEPDKLCSNQQEVRGSNLDDSKGTDAEDNERKGIFNDCEEEEKNEPVSDDRDKVEDIIVDVCDSAPEQVDHLDKTDLTESKTTESPSTDTGNSMQPPLSIDCSGTKDTHGDSSLTFEFYDPAVIAFMPSPKLPQGDDPNISDANFGNPFHSNVQSSQLQQMCGNDSDFNSPDKLINSNSDPFNHSRDVSAPEACDRTGETEISNVASEKKEEKACVNIPHNEVNPESPKGSTEKSSEDIVPCKKKTKSETKKKKKREEKLDSSVSEQESGKKTKSKSKTKSRKSPPEEEEKGKSSGEKQSQSQRSSAEKQPQREKIEAGENGDSWDAMFDDDGDCLDDSVLADITAHVGKVEIERPKIDYLSFTPKESDVNFEVFNHIVEIYDFPSEFGPHDIIGAFKDFLSLGFDLKWVDDTHALGVFSSAIAAKEALKVFHPMLKTRPMCEASRQGLSKAKSCQEFLQPYKERPQTTSMAARRLVAGALGMAPKMSKEMREQERNKLKAAKEKRRQEKQQKVDIWDGSFGKCAMDDV